MDAAIELRMIVYCRNHPGLVRIEWLKSLADGTTDDFLGEVSRLCMAAGYGRESMELGQVVRFIKNLGAAVPQDDRAAQVVHAVIARNAAGDPRTEIVRAAKNMLNAAGGGAQKQNLSGGKYSRLWLTCLWGGEGDVDIAGGAAGYEASKEILRIYGVSPTFKKAMLRDIMERRKYLTTVIELAEVVGEVTAAKAMRTLRDSMYDDFYKNI